MKTRKFMALLIAAVFALSTAAFSTAESDYEELRETLRQQYSLEQMLGIALREAYRLQAEYGVLAAAYPGEEAFRVGLDAADAHLQYMLALCASYGIGPEPAEPPVPPENPGSLQEAYRRMFQAEERHAYMAREFLNNENPPEEARGLLLQLKEQTRERIQACEETAERLGLGYEFHFAGENGEGWDGPDDGDGEGIDNNDDPGQEDGQDREGVDNNDDENGNGVDNNDDPGQDDGQDREGVDNNDDENGEGVNNNDDSGQEGPAGEAGGGTGPRR